MPDRTSHKIEKAVRAARQRRRRGVVAIANDLGLNPSTAGRILERHDVPHPGYGRSDHRRNGVWERGAPRTRYEHKLPAR
jgi:hypothetical protein